MNDIAALRNRHDATSVRVVPVYWEQILEVLSDRSASYETIFPQEFRLLLTERFGPINFGGEEVDSMFSSEFPIRTVVKLNAVLEGLRQKAGKRVASELSSDKDESGFFLRKGKRSLLFVGSWATFWDANYHYPLCFGVRDDEPTIKDAFQSAHRMAYKSDAVSFDGWSLGWIREEDLMSIDAVEEIWARIEPIWNQVRDAAQ